MTTSPDASAVPANVELANALREALDQIGLNQGSLVTFIAQLPDTRARLEYISQLAHTSAERVLDLTEQAQSSQKNLLELAANFQTRFGQSQASGNTLEVSDFVNTVCDQARSVNTQLTEIMMAQEFHDLTSQVTRKVIDMTVHLEQRLNQMLAHMPSNGIPVEAKPTSMQGPRVKVDQANDQSNVDALFDL